MVGDTLVLRSISAKDPMPYGQLCKYTPSNEIMTRQLSDEKVNICIVPPYISPQLITTVQICRNQMTDGSDQEKEQYPQIVIFGSNISLSSYP